MALEHSILVKVQWIQKMAGKTSLHHKDWKYCGKWIRSGILHYVDPAGKNRTYETVERTTRNELSGVDGIDIITLVSHSDDILPDNNSLKHVKRICLVAIYRPPVGKLSLEFPTGLLNPGETLLEAAERELAEETGYFGKIKSIGPIVYCDPWKSNENTALCIAEVNVTGERKVLKLDEDEFVEHPPKIQQIGSELLVISVPKEACILVSQPWFVPLELPLKDLRLQLDLLQKDHGFIVDAKLYSFAVGLELQTMI